MAGILDRLKVALSDRYTIERELGSGGMATVYLAHDLKHERQVALKVMAHSGREIFYIDGQGQMVAVAVTTSPVFAVHESEVLFDPSSWRAAGVGWRSYYDVTPDDQRFIMVRDVASSEPVEVILVENFFEELRQKVGKGSD